VYVSCYSDSSDKPYSTDPQIRKYDSNGNFIKSWVHDLKLPESLDVDSSGNVYVFDGYDKYVYKYDSNGKFIKRWRAYTQLASNEKLASASESYNRNIYGLGIDDSDNVYVSIRIEKGKTTLTQVVKFDSDGKYITHKTYTGTLEKLGVDSFGNVYSVTWSGLGNKVTKLDSNLEFVKSWSPTGSEGFYFDIAVDSFGNSYVGLEGTTGPSTKPVYDQIRKFDPEGKYILAWYDGIQRPYGIAVDDHGTIYVACQHEGEYYVWEGHNPEYNKVFVFKTLQVGKHPL
jgi:sugar lactone lactonase YvrE